MLGNEMMTSGLAENEIVDGIIESVAIDVMNDFFGG
jgi:hypothetical protein